MLSTKRLILPFLTFVLLAVGGCGNEEGSASSAGANVVATTPQVGEMTRAVAGERARVTQILRSNSDPHEFEPRPSDARVLGEADVLVISGGDVDTFAEDLRKSAGGKASKVELIDSVHTIKAGDRPEDEHGHEEEGAPADEVDPHWWQDPTNAIRAVEAVRAALTRADPEGSAAYAGNARAYSQRLRRLDRAIASCMEKVPDTMRKLVTTHDALAYYGRRYEVEIVGALIPSLSTQAQPSGRDIQELVGQIRSDGVQAVFPETALNPRLERAVSKEAGVKVGAQLWADTLGPRGSGAETYLGSLSANTAAMAEGMSGGKVRCRPRA